MVVCACLRSFRLRVLPASSGASVLSVGTSPRRLPALCLHDAGGVGDVVTHGSCVASSTPRMCRDGKLRHKFCQFRFLRALILITRPPSLSSIEPSLQDLCRISEEQDCHARAVRSRRVASTHALREEVEARAEPDGKELRSTQLRLLVL